MQVNSQIPAFKSAVAKVMKGNRVSCSAEPSRAEPSRAEPIHYLANATHQIKKYAAALSGLQSKAESLCATCRSLELSAEKFIVKNRAEFLCETQVPYGSGSKKRKPGIFDVGSGSGRCELGTLELIWQKSVYCSFCRLVIRSLGEQPNTAWINIDTYPTSNAETIEHMNALCYASWQIDGRELYREPAGPVSSSRARTRRIRLHWQDDHFEDAYLVLVSQPTLSSSNLFLGRRVESARSNSALIKSWLEACKVHHGQRCKVTHDQKFQAMISQAYFGVIDLQEMRLTRLPQKAKFVALSYTWGQNVEKLFKTTLKNIRELQADRGLEKVVQRLPSSITGAMKLVRELGERYFWVDSLCIVQDSTKSWELNSKVMDLVYGNAYLTICAADGDNANVGLLAMDSSQRHLAQHVEEYSQGVLLMVSHLAESYIKKSTWNTRAWTFQERLLSRRCVIFTGGRVFFQCRSAAMREDIIAEEEVGWSIEHAHAPLQMLDNLESRALSIYKDCVELYTTRVLTKPDDILSAFTGIGNLVGETLGAGLIYGLPRSHFDWVLLWEPKGEPKERDLSKFPTWSWCGWKDEVVEYKESTIQGTTPNVHEWLMEHTWITWYIRDGYGNLKLIWNASKEVKDSQLATSHWDGYRRDPTSDIRRVDAYGRSKARRWPESSRDRFFKTLPDVPFGVGISADIHPIHDDQLPDQRFLQFWTVSAYLRLTDHSLSQSPSAGNNLRRFGIADYKGDWCGTIVLPQSWEKRVGPRLEYEFLAISEAKEFSQDEYNSWMYYIPKERSQSEWDLYYVLLVIYRDEIAYRVGLGKVYKEAFANSCREDMKWREFILG
jgi:hypothetical protein